MRILLLIALGSASLSCFAGESGKLNGLESELIFHEWPGPKAFVEQLKRENVEPCKFLVDAEIKYHDAHFIVRRILSARSNYRCADNKAIAQKYISSVDPLIRESAIRLAATLPSSEKEDLRATMLKLKKTENDSAVLSAIDAYLAK